MEFNQTELMQLFLSLYTLENENGEDVTEFEKEFDIIFEKYSAIYEVTPFDIKEERENRRKLFAKLVSKVGVDS